MPTTATRRRRMLVPSAASGSSQITYHGISQPRLAISATVDHPAPASQSRRAVDLVHDDRDDADDGQLE